jgi:transcriptional regulator
MRAFVEQQTFATLVAAGPDGRFVATHLPLLIQEWGERTVLRGHVMLDADHGRVLQHAKNVLVTFLGPDAPVLGSWQSTKRFGGTWNYQALHVQGRVEWQRS